MTFLESLRTEFDHEMAGTRKVLERIPDDKLNWRAHPKSNTIGWNASHVADLPNWLVQTLSRPELDIAPIGGEPYTFAQPKTTHEIVELFDRNVAAGREALDNAQDEDMDQLWTLLGGGKPIFTMPRGSVVRGVIMNHLIHHRAHLCVYLRLNDVLVPGLYGPSGD